MKRFHLRARAAVLSVILVSMTHHAHGDTGRWAGDWLIERRTVETDVGDADTEADAGTVEGGVPEMDYAAFFIEPPRELLVDTEQLLSPLAAAERREFLRHHADDSKIELQVYLFGEGAMMPDVTGVERFFEVKNTAVVFYFMGEPQRAGFYLSPSLADVVSEAEQRRSLQSSVMQAAGRADAESQLEAFLVQMSIRLYWMEQMMGDGVAKTSLPVGPDRIRVAEPQNEEPVFPLPPEWLPWIISLGFVFLATPLIWWVAGTRARYRFPEFKVEPRLGGRHAAGVGGVISYLSPNLPPASQRDQAPDYPPRI